MLELYSFIFSYEIFNFGNYNLNNLYLYIVGFN